MCRRHTTAGLAVSALVALVAACGTETGEPGPGDPGSGDWRTERLSGEPAVDFPTVLATDGDDALAVMLSDEGVLQSHLSVDGAGFEAGAPLRTGSRYVGLPGAVRLDNGGWFILGSGGTERIDGDEELTFDPVGFRSADGLHWEQVAVSGFSGPVEFNDLVVVEGGIVAAGSYRTVKDPSSGGFRGAVWFSTDGERFTEVSLPGVGSAESYVGHLEVIGDRLLAAGRTGRAGALWTSDDGGRSWQASEDPAVAEAYALSGLAVVDGTVVASMAEDAARLLRSTDGGDTWAIVPAPAGGGEGWAPVWSAAGRFFTIAGGGFEAWSQPEVCYADLAQCGERAPEAGLYTSDEGATWFRVDVTGLGEVDRVVGTADGRTLVLTGEGKGRTVATWPSATPVPTEDEPAAPEMVELVSVPEGEDPEVGVRYHQPLYVHCGMDWLWFGDTSWRRTDDGPDLETGAGDEPSADWPVVGQTIYGYATLRQGGTVEYSVGDGEVIATYERAEGAPGCA